MQVRCLRCGHLLEYSGSPPRFCSNCGVALNNGSAEVEPVTQIAPVPGHTTPVDRDEQATVAFAGQRPPPDHPETIAGYRLIRLIGGGGMGTVHEAEEIATGRRVALKLIRTDFIDSPDAVERFRREGRLASTILHPRCVFVLAADEEAGRPYIVMELMPGNNLGDLVEQNGPLPVQSALARIFDVIEGLEEAHRSGVIHRDVKPSNCFLDAEGRVKVGDFGLAKALVGPAHLTQSGAFLGTLLFTSPEQIRNDHVNHLTDVYSVCATLYFLLTGRAPFQDKDAAATLARTVSDPLTPMRRHRPELPATLDEVVLRGLARSRRQRWQSMQELELALLPFVFGSHSLAEPGWRISAYLCDGLLLIPLELLVQHGLRAWQMDGASYGRVGALLGSLGISLLCGMIYFAIPESVWGCTPGKFLMRLRVRNRNNDRPVLWRSALRMLWFFLFTDGFAIATALVLLLLGVRLVMENAVGFSPGPSTPSMIAALVALAVLPFLSSGMGLLLLAVSMRRRNGYRGLHEWLSGTHVIRLPGLRARFGGPARTPWPRKGTLPADVPERIGVFEVHGVARRDPESGELVLQGTDTTLDRPVWLWLRQGETGGCPVARRETARATRPRWLAGGRQGDWAWDAFVATPGCLLANLVPRRRLGWMDTLCVLQQLTEELLAASRDGTLPGQLSPGQVWVQASGQVLLLDFDLGGPEHGLGADPSSTTAASDSAVQNTASPITPLELLRQVAAISLEGKPRAAHDLARSIRAPIPGHASELLDRLMGGEGQLGHHAGLAFATLGEVWSALVEAHERPEEISRPGRGLQVALVALALTPGLLLMFLLGPFLLLAGFVLCVLGEASLQVGLEATQQRQASVTADLVARPDVPGKLAALACLAREQHRERDLRNQQEQLERERQRVLLSVGWFIRRSLPPIEQQFRERSADMLRPSLEEAGDLEEQDALAALLGEDAPAGPAALGEGLLEDYHEGVMLLLAWPLLWSLWAGLTRGGIGLRMTGIRLLDKEGRPAARWRCALRVLLIWLPVVGLLLASVFLDLWRMAQAGEMISDRLRVMGWLAWATWWLALLLLPVYAWIAVRWPNGGPHDRLAGTYPVPR